MTDLCDFFKYQAYATYSDFNVLSYNAYSYLIDNNDIIWKLLKYNSPDAWNLPNLTRAEKGALIYSGFQTDETTARAFLDIGQNDVWTKESTIIRISPHNINPKNRTVGLTMMSFEVFSHYKVNTMSNYTTRVDTITMEFIKTFNGRNIGGLGTLFFDGMRDFSDRAIQAGQIPFKGKQIFMSMNSA